jgi:hypothetical protein
MRAALVLAVSAAAHAGLLLALPAPRHHLPAAPTLSEPPEVTIEDSIAIEYVTLPSASPSVAGPEPGPATASASNRPSVTSRLSGSGSVPATGATEVEGPYTGKLAMRTEPKKSGLELSVSPVIAEILDRPPPPEVPSTGKIVEERDGTYTGKDLVFTAHFNPDGTVSSIEDKPNFHYRFHIPKPKKIARAVKKHMVNWAKDPYGVATGTSHESPDGDEDTGDTITIFSGGFDMTDAIMRMNGEDPYAARKRAFLEKTFDERVQIGTAYRAEQLEKSGETMLAHLKKLWARDDIDAAEKRTLIFELWDECAETGGEQLVAGGEKARAALLRFVNVHLPADSADAYTADELRELNARRQSKARFAPY